MSITQPSNGIGTRQQHDTPYELPLDQEMSPRQPSLSLADIEQWDPITRADYVDQWDKASLELNTI
jgi:hypothetical protein